MAMNLGLKVLFVIPSLGNGGAERVIVNLANGMVETGCQVGIMTYRPHGEYEKTLDHRVKLYSCNRRVKSLFAKMLTTIDLLRISKSYDIVISGLELLTDALVIRCKYLSRLLGQRKKFCSMVHITLSQYPRFNEKHSRRRLVQRIYPRFDAIFVVSKGVGDDLVEIIERPISTVHVIYNPVDWRTLHAKAQEDTDVSQYTPFFISIGRLENQKDHRTAIEAFAQFCTQTSSQFHLVILGRGSNERMLREHCYALKLNNVHFLGFCENPWAYMKHATAVVSTSLFEGFPLVLIEAAAVGTPIIATDCKSGPTEILENGRNGYLIPMRDPEAVANAMSQIVNYPEEAQQKAKQAMRFVQALELPEITKQYLDVLSSL